MVSDESTPEQHLSDAAAQVLSQLHEQRTAYFHLGASLAVLASHSEDAELDAAAEAARLLAGRRLVERVRDVAASLPLRGLEYG
jgi:hypothetical protein